MRFVTKIIFSLVLLQFLLLAGGTAIVLRQTRAELRLDFAKRAEFIASSIAASLQPLICTQGSASLTEKMLAKVLATGDLSYGLIRSEGEVLARAGDANLAARRFDDSQTLKNEFEQSRVYTTFAVIEACGAAGMEMELELGFDFQALELPLKKLFRIQMGSLLIQALFSLLLAYFGNRIVSRRIGAIEETCAHISTGDFKIRAAPEGNDEYATISRALNKMIEALQKLTTETDRQRQELAVQSKLSSLGEMAGGVAHEINNPLAIIALRAEQLEEGLQTNELDRPAMLEFVQTIRKTANRIAGITRGLRLFSRNADQDAKMDVLIRTVAEDSISLCAERFRSSGIDLKVNLNCEAKVHARATQISQVIVNLLNNAYDALQDTKVKWVELKIENLGANKVLLTIADSGPGIPLALRDKIMQPFFTTKPVGKGTGLGLSISMGIITEHEGRLYLDETAPHTKFCLELPRLG